MSYGVAMNCAGCKSLIAKVFHNAKKERICPDCLQKDYDTMMANLERSFDEMFKLKQENDMLMSALDAVQKIEWNSVIRSQFAKKPADEKHA